ncbi:MAG: hypothetical protein AABY22_02975 [Nanoarchaeota archaeon]
MSKVSLSISLDNEVASLLDKVKINKSELINRILKKSLDTEAGINEAIDYHRIQINMLEKELELIKNRELDRLEDISDILKKKLKDVNEILKMQPDKLYIWSEIINKNYKQNLTIDEFKRLLKRWENG